VLWVVLLAYLVGMVDRLRIDCTPNCPIRSHRCSKSRLLWTNQNAIYFSHKQSAYYICFVSVQCRS